MHAIFSHARKGALLLNVATVTVYDVRELDPEFELTCLAVAGGYNAASAAALEDRWPPSKTFIKTFTNFYAEPLKGGRPPSKSKNFSRDSDGTVTRPPDSLTSYSSTSVSLSPCLPDS